MNLTLAIDKNLLEQARRAAGAMGLSLNELIRRYLEQVSVMGEPAADFQEFQALCLTRGGHSAGRTWTREDLHHGEYSVRQS